MGRFPQADEELTPGTLSPGILSIPPVGLRISTESLEPSHMDALHDAYTQFQGMRSFVTCGSSITSNAGGTRRFDLDISGPRPEAIDAAALAAYRRAAAVFGDPRPDQPLDAVAGPAGDPGRPNWERTSGVGMTATDLGYLVAALTDGACYDELFIADHKVDILLCSTADTCPELAPLEGLLAFTPCKTAPIPNDSRTAAPLHPSRCRRRVWRQGW